MAEKLYFKIGEACKELDIQPYVLRYWETEFPILKPTKSKSGQRVYSRSDLHMIRRIKELLYDEGFTIAGAKKKLEEDRVTAVKTQPKPREVRVGKSPRTGVKLSRKPLSRPSGKPAAKSPAMKVSKSKSLAQPKLDRAAAKEVKLLRSGIRDSIKEARAILAILEGVSPRD